MIASITQNSLDALQGYVKFPAAEVAGRIAVALGIGLAIGLEREWAHKEVGVRTFAITALLGMLSSLLGPGFALAAFVGVFFLIAYVNIRSLVVERSVEITTSVALMAALLLGVLAGEGHFFTAISSAIAVTMLLAWKAELSRFAVGLTAEEIRSAVFIGLIAFVIYPLLPNRFVDRWGLLNPREIWIVILVLAGIGFANYILLRLYGARGLYYTALLGGLVNSTAAIAELCSWLDAMGGEIAGLGVSAVLLASLAMFVRNLAIVAIFGFSAFPTTLWPLGAMTLLAGGIAWARYRRSSGHAPAALRLTSPLAMRRICAFGVLFVLIQICGNLAERHLGHLGFMAVSVIGGIVSSASTTATAAIMVGHRQLEPGVAGVAVALCSISSSLVAIPLVYHQIHDRGLRRNLLASLSAMALAGIIVLVATWQRYE